MKPELKAYLESQRTASAVFFGLAPEATTDEQVIAYVDMGGGGADSMPDCVFEEFSLAGYRRSRSGHIGIHDWALGDSCEDGIPVFVDDRQLAYRGTLEAARDYAFNVIARLQADGNYRLCDKPAGFLPPPLPAGQDEACSIVKEKPVSAEAKISSEEVEVLLSEMNSLDIEDAITNLGAKCDYQGDGVWNINGKLCDIKDVREFLDRHVPSSEIQNGEAEQFAAPQSLSN